ncbi:MAG: Glycosyl transferase group 1 [candidate division TM6 bacterium GW2011_GWF2_28_16]|nr:MAG: Glycosyl transferase group 1 [candidate division TM6 bacterium GW2011_GWF2_28_16]
MYIHHGKGLGGAPLSLYYLIKNLDKTKYEPVVLFLHNSPVVDLYKQNNIKIAGILNINDFSHTNIYWYRWYHAKYFAKACLDSLKTYIYVANKYLKEIKPDIVHLNTSSLIAWAHAAKKNNIPVITHVREPLSEGYFGLRRNFVKKSVLKNSTFIVPISQNDAKPWAKSNKINIIYNPVDHNKFNKHIDKNDFLQKYNLDLNEPKILFLGGLSQEKGTLIAFKIFEQLLLIMPEAKLIVAGYFDLNLSSKYSLKKYFVRNRYNLKVKNILENIKENIVFTGPITNVEQAIAACDVLINPFTVSHFSRPIIEAGFMSKPVIASRIAPLDEIIIHGVTGYLIDTNNIGVWVEKLYGLLTNKKLNETLGKNAYELCNKTFTVDMHVSKIENLYDKCY